MVTESQPMRIDRFLASTGSFSRSMAQKLLENGHVSVNGIVVIKSSHTVQADDWVKVSIPQAVSNPALQPQDIALECVYEDTQLLIVNKPAGMVVHPAVGNYDGTLVNALMHYLGGNLPTIGGVLRPGIVHRLDKDTSGLMLVAKDDAIHQQLVAMFASKQIQRSYTAICHGRMETQGSIEGNIGRDPKERKRMAIVDGDRGKAARTHYRRMEEFFLHNQWVCCIECQLETGRTHQIRVHLRSIQRPLLGDQVYGVKKEPGFVSLKRQALHSSGLSFTHPGTGQKICLNCSLPKDMEEQLAKLRLLSRS